MQFNVCIVYIYSMKTHTSETYGLTNIVFVEKKKQTDLSEAGLHTEILFVILVSKHILWVFVCIWIASILVSMDRVPTDMLSAKNLQLLYKTITSSRHARLSHLRS